MPEAAFLKKISCSAGIFTYSLHSVLSWGIWPYIGSQNHHSFNPGIYQIRFLKYGTDELTSFY